MVKDSAEAKEVVDMVAKYDLLAVPVVDDEGVLKGIITVDDVMDRLIPCPA
jgi:magnesium transporter